MILAPILLPIAGGIAILLMNIQEDRKRNLFSQTVVCITSVLVWLVMLKAAKDPVDIYHFTDIFSIGFQIDGLGCLFAGMVSVMWPLLMLYAFGYMEHSARKNLFFAFYVMTYGVTLGVCFASNITTVYVFYEMLSLVTIPLVSHYENHESLYAGRKYATYTIGGASLAFFAVVLTTMVSGGADFSLGGSISMADNTIWKEIAYAFAFFGFGVKAAVFPLHDWLPTASVAPTPVTALLHAVAVVNSGVFAVARMTWYVYPPAELDGSWTQILCMMIAVFTLVYAAVLAVKERHFKRKMAYSTVSNLSYMLFGILLMTEAGLAAGLAHMLFHGIIKITLFMCVGSFMHMTGNEYVYELSGVGKKMPVTFTCYTLGSLSLIGIPMFCGFISKWQLLMAGAGKGTIWSIIGVLALIVSAFLCALYTLPASVRAFFPIEGEDRYIDSNVKEAPAIMLIPIVFFSVLNVVFGLWSGPVIDFLSRIASGIL